MGKVKRDEDGGREGGRDIVSARETERERERESEEWNRIKEYKSEHYGVGVL